MTSKKKTQVDQVSLVMVVADGVDGIAVVVDGAEVVVTDAEVVVNGLGVNTSGAETIVVARGCG